MSLNVPIMFVLMKKCMQHYTYFTNYLIQWLWTLCAPETLHMILYTRLYTSIRRACTQDIWCAQAFIFYTGAVANTVCSIHRQIYNLFKPAYMPFIENTGMDMAAPRGGLGGTRTEANFLIRPNPMRNWGGGYDSGIKVVTPACKSQNKRHSCSHIYN